MRCKRCVISNTYSKISFSQNGVCSLCGKYSESHSPTHTPLSSLNGTIKRHLGRELLQKKFDTIRGKYEYDCAVAFSGGKDSTYVLYLLKKVYKLRILAITGDDYMASSSVWENRLSVPRKLGIDHIIVRYDYSLWKQLYRAVLLKSGLRPRAINLVHNLIHEKALIETLNRFDIPFFTSGNSEEELSHFSIHNHSLEKKENNSSRSYWTILSQSYKKVLQEILPNESQKYIDSFLWKKPRPSDTIVKIQYLSFFRYESYIVQRIINTIKKNVGWKYPEDVGGTETDSSGLQFDVCIFRKLYGVEEYAAQISKLVRSGAVTRTIAMHAVNNTSDAIIRYFFKEYNLSWKHLNPQKCTPLLRQWLDSFLPIR